MPTVTTVAGVAVATGGTVAAAAQHHTSISSTILAAAALIGALTALWKFLKLGEILHGTRAFLQDWNGTQARPGVEGRPGFPERMLNNETVLAATAEAVDSLSGKVTTIEKRTEDINHLFRGEVTSRLTLLGEGVDSLQERGSQNHDSLNRLEGRVDQVDARVEQVNERISDHRRRNEEQIEHLREEVQRRVKEAQDNASEAFTRAEAYRASLHEIGIDAKPPTLPHPPPLDPEQ